MWQKIHLEPVLNMYKKAVIHEYPITSKILEMIERGDVDRLDFGSKKQPMITHI